MQHETSSQEEYSSTYNEKSILFKRRAILPVNSSNWKFRAIEGLGHDNDAKRSVSESGATSVLSSVKPTVLSQNAHSIGMEVNSGNLSPQSSTRSMRGTRRTGNLYSSSCPSSPTECDDESRREAGCEALLSPSFPATQHFRACASSFITPLGRDFVLDPLKLNSPNTLFSAAAPMEILSKRPGPIVFLDLGGPETGQR